MDIYLLLGIMGMCMVLITFLGNQMKWLSTQSLGYDITNFVGGTLLTIYSYNGRVWPFVILNAVWALYSLKDIIVDLRRKR